MTGNGHLWSVPALLALVLGLLAGCGTDPAGRQIEVQAGSNGGQMYFTPGRVTVKAGEQIVFVVKNSDAMDHEFESDDLGFGEVTIPAGASRRVPMTAPAKAGSYEIFCDLPGHKEAGMVMHVEVQ